MKIDYGLIKNFLDAFEANDSPTINTLQIFESLKYSIENQEDLNLVMFYMKLLNDQGLIECISNDSIDKNNLGFITLGSQRLAIKVLSFRLTIQGHQTLESMRNEKIWNKIRVPLNKFGIEALKQIPALALQLLTK